MVEAAVRSVPPEPVAGGVLDEPGRREAVAQSLPLLATYFSSAETWDLNVQPGISEQQVQLDIEIAWALRLRALLALAEEFLSILQSISARPTFRYAHVAGESSGLLAGRLDIQRYTERRGRRTAPRVYPIRRVERNIATPENVLVVCALEAIVRAISSAPVERLPPAGPERREIRRVKADLLRHRQLPFVKSLVADRGRVRSGLTLEQRGRLVQRRLERGDIPRGEPYKRLLAWARKFQTGAGAVFGPTDWAFYDYRFDSRLFEIWSLARIARQLSAHFGLPDAGRLAPLWARGEEPIGAWATPVGLIELFFQREMGTVGLPGRWHVAASERPLRAIPDITIRATRSDGTSTWMLMDCKLRPHMPIPPDGASTSATLDLPSEEMYKLFGYFDHLMADSSPLGVLIYYTPGGNGSLPLVASHPQSREGSVALLGVDPADPGRADEAFAGIVSYVDRYLLGVRKEAECAAREAADQAQAEGLDQTEADAAYRQRLMVEVVRSYAKDHEDQLPAIQKLTASWFEPEIWNGLDADTRRMVLSAELYGSTQLEELDHSGPLLVLSAACERELNQRLFGPVLATFPSEKNSKGEPVVNTHATLGGAIETLHRGRRLASLLTESAEDAEARALGSIRDPNFALAAKLTGLYLQQTNQDLVAIAALVNRLRKLNLEFRRPAAHDEVVEAATWSAGRSLILGTDGILSQLLRVLDAN